MRRSCEAWPTIIVIVHEHELDVYTSTELMVHCRQISAVEGHVSRFRDWTHILSLS